MNLFIVSIYSSFIRLTIEEERFAISKSNLIYNRMHVYLLYVCTYALDTISHIYSTLFLFI